MTESVSVTRVLPVALLEVVVLGLKEQLEFGSWTKFEHARLIWPLVGPRKSKSKDPELALLGIVICTVLPILLAFA